TFIKEKKLGIIKFKSIMLAPKKQIANIYALNLFIENHYIIKNNFLCKLLNNLRFHPLTKYDVRKYVVSVNSASYFHEINYKWKQRGAILSKSKIFKYEHFEKLYNLGIPKNSWYVCFHAREAGYSPHDENSHKFRNSLIEDYYKSMDYINSQGGYCIRIGDQSMKPIIRKEGYIDYAISEFKNDEMDLFIAANCKFFVGSASGALAMSGVFGVPLACANLAPLSHSFVRNKGDIGIPKLYKNINSGKLINFKEIMNRDLSNFRNYDEFINNNITLINNSEEDILNMVKEQYLLLNNNLNIDEIDIELQNKFRRLFKKKHYSYFSESIVSYSFLKKYRYLL
ncbi:TIGR04372 family glycosyltransferase, partial [Alphaproteobacteria bacterium]|nr:TIGR04372 family glycosyltransferase [Alphaproteobacteria bacterium]